MKFSVLGHGALSVRADGTHLLVDPWLGGSCYWRSWWHYPPSVVAEDELAPDFVYLSHHHFDHFHYPSMRRLDRKATVLVPRFAVDVMPKEVRGLGFERVRELRHGEVVELAPGLRVASFQYGFDDSALLVESGGVVLADLNDCKIRGRAMAPLLETFGRPTFLFKSHSWAQAYPVRYRAEDPADLELVSRATYVADFVEIVDAMRPGFAVPFASMVGFLHPETAAVNEAVVTPREIAEGFSARPVPGSEVVVMAPGDSWDTESGFSFGDTDWFDPGVRSASLAGLRDQARAAIDRAAEDETGVQVSWYDFYAYFDAFVHALPSVVARFLLPRPVAFHVPSGGSTPVWVVDARHRRVQRLATPPKDVANVIHVREGILADAIAKKVVNLLHISLRLEIELRRGGLSTDLTFWGLLAMWEIGYLPVGEVPRRRLIAAVWRRRRELLELATHRLIGRGSFAQRMTGGLMVTPGDEGRR